MRYIRCFECGSEVDDYPCPECGFDDGLGSIKENGDWFPETDRHERGEE
jgi:hypothetical protein